MAFYFMLSDNYTSTLIERPPPWGRPLTGLPAAAGFHMTDWHDLAHVLVTLLHASLTLPQLSFSITAAPFFVRRRCIALLGTQLERWTPARHPAALWLLRLQHILLHCGVANATTRG